MIQRTLLSAVVAAIAIGSTAGLTGCAATGGQQVTAQAASAANPAAAIRQRADLSTLARLVQQAGLETTLQGNVTVFAPNDEAFKAVPAATLDKLAKDSEALKAVLSYHVLPTVLKSDAIPGATQVVTAQGAKLSLSKAGDFITADDSLVISADQPAGGGVVHVVDRVLMPPKK